MSTYNWQEDGESFLKWFVVHLVATDGDHEKLSAATNKFTEIDFKVSINGIEMPIEHFVERIEANMEWKAQKRAAEIVKEIPRLVELQDFAYQLEIGLKQEIRKAVDGTALGKHMREYDEDND